MATYLQKYKVRGKYAEAYKINLPKRLISLDPIYGEQP